ncbi:HTH_Tnp_Tc3_2 domain-containing protein [Trichonephila clavipes]|nr:HTH_Tnp_Tc3_2 domain-containing protein [Trichonephila clavipes]
MEYRGFVALFAAAYARGNLELQKKGSHDDYLSTFQRLKKIPQRRIRAHYEQLTEFERGRIIELKEAGWANRRIARHIRRSDLGIKRCWQEWVDSGRFQRHDGSG